MTAVGSEVEGVHVPNVTAWLEANVAGARGPFTFDVIAGGHSNITYRVTGADGTRYVLRRPPLGHVLATAHDMGREYRIIAALQSTDVPVPPALGLCTDEAVNGSPFYVMGFVEGVVVRDVATAEANLTPEQRRSAGLDLADVLAHLHAVDPEAVGLGDLGRHDGYIERQLRRWHRQWEQSKTRELPLVDQVHAELARRVPEQRAVSIVHGDYRLDNCMTSFDGRIAAVLDWEICTLGDPMADVGLLHVYHQGPGDPPSGLTAQGTTAPGFPTKAEVIARYGQTSGRDLSELDFYIAFGFWKLACIIEGVYARYLGGAMGQARGASDEALRTFDRTVVQSVESAAAALERLR